MKKKSVASDIELLMDLPVKVDSIFLKDQLKAYRNPIKKIFDLVAKEYLAPVRRGQYLNLKSKDLPVTPLEALANSLYQPSYISAEWALQHYGLLMERVHTITSVCFRKSISLETPIGHFSFEHINRNRYSVGYVLEDSISAFPFLIARPEKALLDYFSLRMKNTSWSHRDDIAITLNDDLRLDITTLLKITPAENLQELLPYYHRNSLEARLLRWLLAEQGEKHV